MQFFGSRKDILICYDIERMQLNHRHGSSRLETGVFSPNIRHVLSTVKDDWRRTTTAKTE